MLNRSKSRRISLLPLAALAAVVVLPLASVAAQPTADDPAAALVEVNNSLDQEIRAAQQANREARQRLRTDEQMLKAKNITPARLEQTRLDASAQQTQIDSIEARLRARRDNIGALERELAELQLELETGDSDETTRDRLDAQQQLRDELTNLTAKLETLKAVTREQLQLTQRRLELLQQRFDLDALQPSTARGPQRQEILSEIDQYIKQASELRVRLREVGAETPAQLANKYLLETRVLDAGERAELSSARLSLLDDSREVRQLAVLSENQAMPERALRKAREQLASIKDDLEGQSAALGRKLEVVQEAREITQQRGAIAEGEAGTLDAQLAIIDALSADIEEQTKRIDGLLQTAGRADKRFVAVIGNAARRELVKRRTLPHDSQAWRELGADLTTLPGRVLANLAGAARAVGQRIASAGVSQWLLLLVLGGGVVAAILWLRRFLDRSLIQKDLDKGAVLPMCALYWSLPALIPAAVLIVLGVVLQISATNFTLLLTLLLIWPAIKFSLKMSFYLLVDEAPPESIEVRTRLHRELQWVLTLVGLIVGLSVIAHVVALSPGVIDVLERFSMVCLLLVALPALHVRQVILARSETDMKEMGFWIRFAAALSLLAPIVLIGCALIGLVGYVPLAWAITTHLGWLAVVVAGWLLAEAALRDGTRWLSRRVDNSAGESADFWNQNIIAPLYKLSALGLTIIAGLVLFAIFGWSSQTPVIRLVPQILNTDLFTVGDTTIEIEALVLAVVVVVLVFWLGSWSKQVSYKFAYARIGDYGIRQSLATFTQYAVVVVGFYIALKTIGLDLTALTVFAGALGVGIGFGLQNITSNFISGILLLIERPLRVTDIVNVEGIDGTVTHIGIRALKVRTFEQQEVVVPNSSVITKPFTNWTGGDDIYRTMFYVRVRYDTDPHQAIDIITNIVQAQPGVVSTPAPKVVLNDFTESCMLIRVQYFTHVLGDVGLLDARSQILFAIWDAFREAGIEIPFPQQDVHVKQLPNDSGALPGKTDPV